MKVTNMTSPKTGRSIPNQFIITDEYNDEYFQSYDRIIAKKETCQAATKDRGLTLYLKTTIYLDKHYWDYSTTTGKYRNQFLGETKKETQKKIDSGEYVLTDLNGG